MTAQRFGAFSLIAGAILAMLVFAFHPAHVAHAPLLGPFTLSQLVHGTALVAAPLLAIGMWQMAEWLGLSRPLVRLALILSLFAMMLTINAAVISNFVTPAAARATMAAMHHAAPATAHKAKPHAAPRHGAGVQMMNMPPLVQVSVALNRGLAQVHVAYLSLAILLFALAMLGANRWLAVGGAAVGLFPILWQLSGRFSPETTTMPWIVFPQSLWLIAAAAAMLRAGADANATPAGR